MARQLGLEAVMGLHWMTWTGIGLVFLAVAFFLKFAYDQQWLGHLIGPRMRILLAIAAAGTLLVLGWRSRVAKMAALGQGLLGGGMALLYLSVYAARQPALLLVSEPLIGPITTFAAMALITALGLLMAVALEARTIAIIAMLGGFATPLLVGGSGQGPDLLFTYLTILDLGVLGVAFVRRWRALDVLALAGTVILFALWYADSYHDLHPEPLLRTVAWLLDFHLLLLLLPFARHWRDRTAVTLERFSLSLGNIASSMAYARLLLGDLHPQLLGLIGLVIGGIYLAIGLLTHQRVRQDSRTLHGFLALASLFLVLGTLYLLPVDAVSCAWAAEAAMMLLLGHRFAYVPSRYLALVLLGASWLRFLLTTVPPSTELPFLDNPWCISLAILLLLTAVFPAIHRRWRAQGAERQAGRAVGLIAGLIAGMGGSGEIIRHALGHAGAWQAFAAADAIACWLLVVLLGYLAWARWTRQASAFLTGLLPLGAAIAAAGSAYAQYPSHAWLLLNGCGLVGLAVAGASVLVAVLARRWAIVPGISGWLRGLSLLLAMLFVSVEVAAWLQRGIAAGTGTSYGVLIAVWLLLALGCQLLARIWTSWPTWYLGWLPLAASLVALLLWYEEEGCASQVLLANPRFVLAALAAGLLAAAGLLRPGGGDPSSPTRGLLACLPAGALAWLLLATTIEILAWQHPSAPGRELVETLLAAAWLLESLLGCWFWRTSGDRGLIGVGSLAPIAGVVCSLGLYGGDESYAWMLLNSRFACAALAVAALAVHARFLPGVPSLAWGAPALGFLVLTLEPPSWLGSHIANAGAAHRASVFSITVVWSAIAFLALLLGFWRGRPPLRLCALGLFGITAAKLLLIDMSGEQQIYRILAFFVVGVVFITASWAYHRWLRSALPPADAPSSPPAGPPGGAP